MISLWFNKTSSSLSKVGEQNWSCSGSADDLTSLSEESWTLGWFWTHESPDWTLWDETPSRSVAGVETEPAAAVRVCLFRRDFHRQRREADDFYLLWSFWTQNESPEQQDVWDVRECEHAAESARVIFYISFILHDKNDQQTSVNVSLCSSAGCRSAASLPRCS